MKREFLKVLGIALSGILALSAIGVVAAGGLARFQVSQGVPSSLTVSAFTVLDGSKMRLTTDAKGTQPVTKIDFIGLKRAAPLGGLEIAPVDVYYGNLAGMDMHLVQPCYTPIYASNVIISVQQNIDKAKAKNVPADVIAQLQAAGSTTSEGSGVSVPPTPPGLIQVGYIQATINTMDGGFAGNACDQQGINVSSGQQVRLAVQPYLWNDSPETGIYSIPNLVFGAVDGPNSFPGPSVCLSCGRG